MSLEVYLLLQFSGKEHVNITSKEQRLCRLRRAERSYSMFKLRRGGHEEIPLIHSKEQ